jgi:hypothetical protein
VNNWFELCCVNVMMKVVCVCVCVYISVDTRHLISVNRMLESSL